MRSILKLFLFWLILTLFPCPKGWSQPSSTVVINELMINPNNVASLPAFEYIELYNNGNISVDLSSLVLQINNNQITLPSYTIAPRQYAILCSPESASQFSRFGNAVPLSRWYALNNAGATIRLSLQNEIIDEVSYRDTWYNSTTKKNGGWSLERINPNWICNINLNWSATHSLSGGTPGKSNTIYDKEFLPSLTLSQYAIQDNKLEIQFNIEAEYLGNINPQSFRIDNEVGAAIQAEREDGKIILTFSKSLDPQKLYTLHVGALTLCNLSTPDFEAKLFDQKQINRGDIVINEILFNPREGGVDFVELLNTTDHPINLQNFRLGNRIITTTFHLLESKGYMAISTNKKITLQHYPLSPEDNILQTAALPPYANQQGIVTLFSDQNILLDSIYYNSNMHAAHIVQPKGISLERLSPTKDTFHSASTLVGGATPGYRNSTADLDIKENKVYLQSQTFSPNDDGYEDELLIHYELIHPNYIIAVEIYNERGQLMKKLAHQNLAGTHGTLIWDGRNENGQRCIKGHYICYTKIFNQDGKTQHFKQPFVLIYSLTRH